MLYDSSLLTIMNDSTVYSLSAGFDEVGCDKRQAMRFLGCSSGEVGQELEELYCDCLRLAGKECFFRAVWRKSAISFCGEDTVEFEFGRITSAALCRNLQGCKSAYVFAATAGHGIDRLMLRYKSTDTAKAMVISCIGSSAVECWCDIVNRKIADGRRTRPRFSPGYGGVDLKCQKEVLEFLDAGRKTGISLTDSYFMTPVKSVTAFIGIEEE